jgi:hypothetical protein
LIGILGRSLSPNGSNSSTTGFKSTGCFLFKTGVSSSLGLPSSVSLTYFKSSLGREGRGGVNVEY